jgi:hypothetical protein
MTIRRMLQALRRKGILLVDPHNGELHADFPW